MARLEGMLAAEGKAAPAKKRMVKAAKSKAVLVKTARRKSAV